MNTAISIPDPIFETAERLAQTLRISRNELYTRALSAYIEVFDDNTLRVFRFSSDATRSLDSVMLSGSIAQLT